MRRWLAPRIWSRCSIRWADDDPRERYEITFAPASFGPWLQGHRDDLAEGLADEMMLVRRIAAGDGAHDWGGHAQPWMIATTHDDVLGWRGAGRLSLVSPI